MPFNKEIANQVLANNVGSFIALFTGAPSDSGDATGLEPTIDNTATGVNGGYRRGVVNVSGSGTDGWDTSKDRQIANKHLILMFEAREALGTKVFTHFGLYDKSSGGTLKFYGELANPLTVSAGYVPLVRAFELIIAMDVDEIDTDY